MHAVILEKRPEYASAMNSETFNEVFSSILAPNVRFELNQYFWFVSANLVGKSS